MEILSPERRQAFLQQPCHFCGYSGDQGTIPDVLRIHELGFFPICSFCKEIILTYGLDYNKAIELGKKVRTARDSWNGAQSEFKNSKKAREIKNSFAQQS
jgi:hypothetical protein